MRPTVDAIRSINNAAVSGWQQTNGCIRPTDLGSAKFFNSYPTTTTTLMPAHDVDKTTCEFNANHSATDGQPTVDVTSGLKQLEPAPTSGRGTNCFSGRQPQQSSDIRGSLVTTAFLAGSSIVLGALAVQLLFRLTALASRDSSIASANVPPFGFDTQSTLLSSMNGVDDRAVRAVVQHIAVALAAVVVAVDMCCVLAASFQCYLVIQLIQFNNECDKQVSLLD